MSPDFDFRLAGEPSEDDDLPLGELVSQADGLLTRLGDDLGVEESSPAGKILDQVRHLLVEIERAHDAQIAGQDVLISEGIYGQGLGEIEIFSLYELLRRQAELLEQARTALVWSQREKAATLVSRISEETRETFAVKVIDDLDALGLAPDEMENDEEGERTGKVLFGSTVEQLAAHLKFVKSRADDHKEDFKKAREALRKAKVKRIAFVGNS